MKQFMITVAAVVTALIVFFVGIPFMLIMGAVGSSKPSVPHATVLTIDLREKMSDQSSNDPFAFITGKGLSTIDVVTSLHRAADDSKVKSVLIRLPEGGMSPAAAEEIERAVKFFRKSGKMVYAHSQGLYPDTMVIASYMLGTSASEFWMQPQAAFQVTGISTENVFFKRAFDKYGIKAEYEQRYEFKNAVNPYLYSDFTPAHRESTLSWMNSIYGSMITTAAADLKIKDPAKLRAMLESGPFGAERAKELGLITHLGQVHEVEQIALKQGGDNTELMDISTYSRTQLPSTGSETIAVINGEGAIMTGHSGGSGFNRETQMLSDDVSGAIYDAIEDDKVKAIVFRVSSPGGSDTASEQILTAVKAAKAKGKPVVISMGEYAASGGYWISSDASAIVSNPSTLTGSIGVYGGKFALGDALGKYGLDMRQIGVGSEYAGAYGSSKPFTAAQHAGIASWIDGIYNGFIQRVSKGRHIPEARVREIAKGRVWTGEQALKLGLVDELGGYYEAIAKAKKLAKIPDNAQVRLVSFPDHKSPFSMFSHAASMSLNSLKALNFMGWAMSDPKAEIMMQQVSDARLRSQGAAVLAPEPYQPSVR